MESTDPPIDESNQTEKADQPAMTPTVSSEEFQRLKQLFEAQSKQLQLLQAANSTVPSSEVGDDKGNTQQAKGNTPEDTKGNTQEYIKDLNTAPEFASLTLEWGEFEASYIKTLQSSSAARQQLANAHSFQNAQVIDEGVLVPIDDFSRKRHKAFATTLVADIDSTKVSDEQFRQLVATYHSSTILPSLASFSNDCQAIITRMDALMFVMVEENYHRLAWFTAYVCNNFAFKDSGFVQVAAI